MKLQLEWFNSDCLQHSEKANLAVQELNSALMDDFYWKLDTENWELRLWDIVSEKLVPGLREKIVNVLESMNVSKDQISATTAQLQVLFEWSPQS